jgi:hypothetical protein
MRHSYLYTLLSFIPGEYWQSVRTTQAGRRPKQRLSLPHNHYRIDGAAVGKVFRNRSRAPVSILKVQPVFRQAFPAAQLFEFLSTQGMKPMYYTEPPKPFITTICSADPSLTGSTTGHIITMISS